MFLLLAIGLTNVLVRQIKKHQRLIEKARDTRVNLLSEVLQGIAVVKMFAWESQFQDRLNERRMKEVHHLTKKLYYGVGFKV